jgi:type I restriction enzyme M protein
MLSNPPFGVEWKKIEKEIRKEAEEKGFDGRFGPGLPRVSDGSLLFLLHLISKMRPAVDGGSRFGIVLNGSHSFTGGAGSGESEIRRYVLENDLVEAIIGLPTDMFYNTGISTYVWIVSNRKLARGRGRCSSSTQAASGRKCERAWQQAKGVRAPNTSTRSLGSSAGSRNTVVTVCPSAASSRMRISAIRQSLWSARSATLRQGRLRRQGKGKGKPQPDSSLRDTENVPLNEDVNVYFKREVLPHAPDAWIDHEKTKVGYDIPFNRHFYVFKQPRSLSEIDAELKGVTDRILTMIGGLTS